MFYQNSLPPNKRMQSDQVTRYASTLAADARRSVVIQSMPREILFWIFLVISFAHQSVGFADDSNTTQGDIDRKHESPERQTQLEASQSYANAIQQKIMRHWYQPAVVDNPANCEVRISQSEEGLIEMIEFLACDVNSDQYLRSIELAIMNAEPLPPPPAPDLFERDIYLIFKPY